MFNFGLEIVGWTSSTARLLRSGCVLNDDVFNKEKI